MSTINRILHRENISTACFLFGTGTFTYLYGRESLFLKQYVNYIQKYQDKEPVPVQNVLKFRLATVLHDLNISEYNREFYELFITKELDPKTCGSVNVRQGVKIGIPEHYQAPSIQEVQIANSTIRGTVIPWTSEDGQKLSQSLSLSESAQKFAIAKAVLMSENYYYFFHAAFPIFFTWGYFVFTELIFSYRKLHLRSGLFTLSTYILGGVLFGAMYVFCEDILHLQYDKITFEDALKISHAYILGGIEYSEKEVERNKALRNIVRNGDSYFDEDGDLKTIVKSTGLLSSIKVELAKAQLKQYEFDQDAMAIPPVNPNPHPVF